MLESTDAVQLFRLHSRLIQRNIRKNVFLLHMVRFNQFNSITMKEKSL